MGAAILPTVVGRKAERQILETKRAEILGKAVDMAPQQVEGFRPIRLDRHRKPVVPWCQRHPDLAEQWLSPRTDKYLRLSLYFFLGGSLYVFKHRVILWGPAAIALWLLTLISYKSSLFSSLFAVALAYSVLWLALIPRGFVRRFNSVDDYSYGIYIYAFPVQQAIVATHNDIGEATLFGTAFMVTLVLAWLSCNLVEKPASRLSSHLTRRYYEHVTPGTSVNS